MVNGSGNGVGIQAFRIGGAQPPDSNVYVHDNQIHGNGLDGIFVHATGDRIINNDASNNDARLNLPFFFDLHDTSFNPTTFEFNCFGNTWSGNIWGSPGFSPDCTSTGGHLAGTGKPKPHGATNASVKDDETPPVRHKPTT
jgi:parallel beta-helix repeat protein